MEILEMKAVYSKENPFMARLVDRYRLTTEASDKCVIHVVLDIQGSEMEYECGDSVGVYAPNCEGEVQGILRTLSFTGDEVVELNKVGQLTLYEALKSHLSLDKPSKKFLDFCGVRVDGDIQEYGETHSILDVICEATILPSEPQVFVDHLRRLLPRLYSIASSPFVSKDLIDLTVGVVHYEANGRKRWGVASGHLARDVEVGEKVGVYISKSHFKLPEDLDADIIMVGPGTGVAPFRGFLQERVAKGGGGRAWLFFGDRTRDNEYLYEDDWNEFRKKGVLTHLDLAFSRDQDHKIYVQHLLLNHSKEIYRWIQGGGYFYVCGDMKRMAKDVDLALHQIVMQEGSLSEEEAVQYIKHLKKEKRYQRDVY